MKKLLIIVVALAALAGCKSQETIAYKYFRDKPDKLAALCATNFPVGNDYKQGQESTKHDTVTLAGEVIPCPEATIDPVTGKPKTVYVKVPDTKTIYTTRTRVDTVYKENTARVAALQATNQTLTNNNAVLTDNLQKMTAERNRYRWAVIIGALAALTFIIFKVIKR